MFGAMTDDPELQKLRWSIRRVIELLEEGIDSAGEQLVQGEDLRAWRTPVGGKQADDCDSELGVDLSP
jgi:hypothetical protein